MLGHHRITTYFLHPRYQAYISSFALAAERHDDEVNSRSLALILMSDRRLDAGQLHRVCDVMTRYQVARLFCI